MGENQQLTGLLFLTPLFFQNQNSIECLSRICDFLLSRGFGTLVLYESVQLPELAQKTKQTFLTSTTIHWIKQSDAVPVTHQIMVRGEGPLSRGGDWVVFSDGIPLLANYRMPGLIEGKWLLGLQYSESGQDGPFYELSAEQKITAINPQLPTAWHDSYKYSGMILTSAAGVDKVVAAIDNQCLPQFFMEQHRAHSLLGWPVAGLSVGLHQQLTETSITRINNWCGLPFKPCLFLDRDGVMIKDVGYPHKIEDVEIFEEIVPLIAAANQKGWLVIVVSNQAGLAKGLFTEEDYQKFTGYLRQAFERRGVTIDQWLGCPYHPRGKVLAYCKQSLQRKPQPGMILQAMETVMIDLSQSLMIGDKPSDDIEHVGLTTFFLQGNYAFPSGFQGKRATTHRALVEQVLQHMDLV